MRKPSPIICQSGLSLWPISYFPRLTLFLILHLLTVEPPFVKTWKSVPHFGSNSFAWIRSSRVRISCRVEVDAQWRQHLDASLDVSFLFFRHVSRKEIFLSILFKLLLYRDPKYIPHLAYCSLPNSRQETSCSNFHPSSTRASSPATSLICIPPGWELN